MKVDLVNGRRIGKSKWNEAHKQAFIEQGAELISDEVRNGCRWETYQLGDFKRCYVSREKSND